MAKDRLAFGDRKFMAQPEIVTINGLLKFHGQGSVGWWRWEVVGRVVTAGVLLLSSRSSLLLLSSRLSLLLLSSRLSLLMAVGVSKVRLVAVLPVMIRAEVRSAGSHFLVYLKILALAWRRPGLSGNCSWAAGSS